MSRFIGVRHVGPEARDLAALTAFYRDVMGMTVVRGTPTDSPFGAAVFLVGQPGIGKDHDLVLFSNPTLAHTAYAVASLAELKASYREMTGRGDRHTSALVGPASEHMKRIRNTSDSDRIPLPLG